MSDPGTCVLLNASGVRGLGILPKKKSSKTLYRFGFNFTPKWMRVFCLVSTHGHLCHCYIEVVGLCDWYKSSKAKWHNGRLIEEHYCHLLEVIPASRPSELRQATCCSLVCFLPRPRTRGNIVQVHYIIQTGEHVEKPRTIG